MFWSLILEPGKRYSSTVSDTFHLSTATLDVKSAKADPNEVYPVQLEIDNQQLILCNLTKSHFLQVSLDLVFAQGTRVTFFTTGKATIHLTGYLINDDMTDCEEEASDEESEVEESKLKKDVPKSKGDTKVEKAKQQKNVKQESPTKRKIESPDQVASKKPKALKRLGEEDSEDDTDDDDESDDLDMDTLNSLGMSDSDGEEEDDEDEDDDDDDDDDDMVGLADSDGDESDDEDDEDDDDDTDEDGLDKSKKTPQKLQQTPKKQNEKTPNKNKTPLSSQKDGKQGKLNKSQMNGTTPKSENKNKNKNTPQQGKTPNEGSQGSPQKKTTLEGGVTVEELKAGNGPVAKPGKMASVYYVGRLKNNNRIFDQTSNGPAFKFRLGRSEVIKGWDIGVNGMKVGSKRRITCPASMAYGSKGSPPTIPPNSTLVFDVELKSVN